MAEAADVIQLNALGATRREDAWWIEPLLTDLALIIFVIYSMWRVFNPAETHLFQCGPYLSPFYSPDLVGMFPQVFGWLRFAPALVTIWIPVGFRGTCYFYRRAYYRSFFMDPPACAVGEKKSDCYTGERKFPFVLNNLHRYFFYFAFILMIFHWVHAVTAYGFSDGVHVGVGSLVITLDAILLSTYVLSCHSWRHLVGGKLDSFSCCAVNKIRYTGWQRISKLNENHMFFAWASLFTVGFADLYVRMVAAGVWTDWRLF